MLIKVEVVEMRKGYLFERYVKKKLEEQYGKGNVIKVPFWEYKGDFLVLENNKIALIVECKSAKKKWRMNRREEQQLRRLHKFCSERNIPAELWIKEKRNITKINLNKFLGGDENDLHDLRC